MDSETASDIRVSAMAAPSGGALIAPGSLLPWFEQQGNNGSSWIGIDYWWGRVCLVLGVATALAALTAGFARAGARLWLVPAALALGATVIAVYECLIVSDALFWYRDDGHLEVMGQFFELGNIGLGLIVVLLSGDVALVAGVRGARLRVRS